MGEMAEIATIGENDAEEFNESTLIISDTDSGSPAFSRPYPSFLLSCLLTNVFSGGLHARLNQSCPQTLAYASATLDAIRAESEHSQILPSRYGRILSPVLLD